MPFICTHLKISDCILYKKQKNYTLQVQDPKLLSGTYKWKVSLLASEGSLTVEAAVVITLFLFSIVGVLYLFTYYHVQLYIQEALEKTTEDILISSSKTLRKYDGSFDYLTDEYISKIFWSNINQDDINNSNIKNGCAGLELTNLEFNSNEGILKFGVKYSFVVPFIFAGHGTLETEQYSVKKMYVGSDYSEASRRIVYMTMYGQVYHLSKECTYIKHDIVSLKVEDIENKRNNSGGRYYPCSICMSKGESIGLVYISPWGSSYHSNKDCSSLARLVRSLSMRKAEEQGYRQCSKCGA